MTVILIVGEMLSHKLSANNFTIELVSPNF